MSELNDRLVISGPIGTIFFELLQLVLILHVSINYLKINRFEGYMFLCGFIIHTLRLYLNYEISIKKTNKNKILNLISLLFLVYTIVNNFNYFGFEILFALLYSFLAITNFLVLKKESKLSRKVWRNRKIFYFIPLTIYLLYLSYFNMNSNILPLILGDGIYHLVDIILYLYECCGM